MSKYFIIAIVALSIVTGITAYVGRLQSKISDLTRDLENTKTSLAIHQNSEEIKDRVLKEMNKKNTELLADITELGKKSEILESKLEAVDNCRIKVSKVSKNTGLPKVIGTIGGRPNIDKGDRK